MANSTTVTMTTGRLTREPEIRETTAGKKVTNMSVAVNQWDGKQEVAEFQTWVLWGSDAEYVCKYASKGEYVSLVGYSKTREWENKEGQTVKVSEFWARQVVLCGKSGKEKSSGGDFDVMESVKKKASGADLPF